MVNIQNLIDDAKCFETVRALRWSDGYFLSALWFGSAYQAGL